VTQVEGENMTKPGNRFGWNAFLLMTTAFTAFGIAEQAQAQTQGV
jgi:hypothetical protein